MIIVFICMCAVKMVNFSRYLTERERQNSEVSLLAPVFPEGDSPTAGRADSPSSASLTRASSSTVADSIDIPRLTLILTTISIALEIFCTMFITATMATAFLLYEACPKLIPVVLCLAWQSDNGGLFIGSTFGKHKFNKHISPNKTVEGILGCFLLCFGSAVVMWLTTSYQVPVFSYLYPALGWQHYLILGAVISVTSIVGDLTESFIKRAADVKVSHPRS